MPTTTTQGQRQRIRALERPALDVHIVIGAAGTPGAELGVKWLCGSAEARERYPLALRQHQRLMAVLVRKHGPG